MTVSLSPLCRKGRLGQVRDNLSSKLVAPKLPDRVPVGIFQGEAIRETTKQTSLAVCLARLLRPFFDNTKPQIPVTPALDFCPTENGSRGKGTDEAFRTVPPQTNQAFTVTLL